MLNRLIESHPTVRQLRQNLDASNRTAWALKRELEEAQDRIAKLERKPARISMVPDMTEIAIEESLVGTENHPAVKAICTLLAVRIVELSDTATDRPRTQIQIGDQHVAGYSAEERMHDAGGCAHLAEFLGKLQVLTKPKAETSTEAQGERAA